MNSEKNRAWRSKSCRILREETAKRWNKRVGFESLCCLKAMEPLLVLKHVQITLSCNSLLPANAVLTTDSNQTDESIAGVGRCASLLCRVFTESSFAVGKMVLNFIWKKKSP